MTKGPMGRSSLRTDSISWDDLDALRKIWPHKLIVKGMLDPHDAADAVNHGADGIDVSNHGGRNLDGIISPMEVLPEIVDAVGKRATVVRRQWLPPRQRCRQGGGARRAGRDGRTRERFTAWQRPARRAPRRRSKSSTRKSAATWRSSASAR
jgi:hypothetical protein